MAKPIKLWRYNPVTGYWVHERMCQPDTADRWLEIFRRDAPDTAFRLAKNKPSPNAKPRHGERECERDATPLWHVVTSQGGNVLGVFGEALLSHAQECARSVERQTGFPAYVNQVRGARPTL